MNNYCFRRFLYFWQTDDDDDNDDDDNDDVDDEYDDDDFALEYALEFA